MRGNCWRVFIQGKKSCRIFSLEEFHDGNGLGGLSKGTCRRTKLRKAIALEGASWGQLLGGQLFRRMLFMDNCPGQRVMGTDPGRFSCGAVVQEVFVRGVIVQKKMSWGQKSMGHLSWGKFHWGYCSWYLSGGELFQERTIWQKFHEGSSSGGNRQW